MKENGWEKSGYRGVENHDIPQSSQRKFYKTHTPHVVY